MLRIAAGADHFSVKTASVRLSSGRISTGNARAGPLKASALSLWGQASPSIPIQPSWMPAPSFTVIHGRAWGAIPAISYLGQDAPRLHSYSAQGSLAIPHTQACVYKRWQAIPALTGRGIIQEQLIGSLSRSIHVLILSRIALSQLPIKHASSTRAIPHFTPLSQIAL